MSNDSYSHYLPPRYPVVPHLCDDDIIRVGWFVKLLNIDDVVWITCTMDHWCVQLFNHEYQVNFPMEEWSYQSVLQYVDENYYYYVSHNDYLTILESEECNKEA